MASLPMALDVPSRTAFENQQQPQTQETSQLNKGFIDDLTNNPIERRCLFCGTTNTPQWRSGPNHERILCDACGKSYSKGTILLATDALPGKSCAQCGTHKTICWRAGGRRCGGLSFCNECGLKLNAKKQKSRITLASMRGVRTTSSNLAAAPSAPGENGLTPQPDGGSVSMMAHNRAPFLTDCLVPAHVGLSSPADNLESARDFNEYINIARQARSSILLSELGVMRPIPTRVSTTQQLEVISSPTVTLLLDEAGPETMKVEVDAVSCNSNA